MDERIAEEHAEWFARIAKAIYKTAFIHGFKHGGESNER